MIAILEDYLSWGYLGVFVFSLILNLIPFLSPSNIVISGAAGSILYTLNPIIIGFFVALGASLAKTIHFVISFFIGRALNRRRVSGKAGYDGRFRMGKLGAIAAFIAAVSPIPDDPIVIPLGLIRYNPLKFFIVYFTGKMLVGVTGAFIGQRFSLTMEQILGQTATVILSIILTAILIVAFLKIDYFLSKMGRFRIVRRILTLIGWEEQD